MVRADVRPWVCCQLLFLYASRYGSINITTCRTFRKSQSHSHSGGGDRGRLGYVLFYNFSYYLDHPLEISATWNGGMSFHGACLALIIAGWVFCRKNNMDFWKTADIYTATCPIGLGLGRIGNFINGELYGRVTDLPWGMVFPGGGPLPRHPSQLYQSFLEGFVLFVILWSIHRKPWQNKRYWPHGSIIRMFLIGYGCLRIIVEYFREPDQQIGYLFDLFTMGQLLSGFMVGCGLAHMEDSVKS